MKIIYTLMLILAASQLKAEFCLSQIRSDVDAADMFCMSNRWDYSMLQDAMNFDVERLRRCSLHVFKNGKTMPFCAAYLTPIES